MGFLSSLLKGKHREENSAPPEWQAAPGRSYAYGLKDDATEDEYQNAENFCLQYPPDPPRILPSHALETISQKGCGAWGLEYPQSSRFAGEIDNPALREKSSLPPVVFVQTGKKCKDTCLLSDLPILFGQYDAQGKEGVYYEITIRKMKGVIALGTACRPYPQWRLPGWNRLSAGLHLDDFRKFFEDPDGGKDYDTPDYPGILSKIHEGDTIGCGYEFSSYSLFYTYNGVRLPPAFTGIYLPLHLYDVFAAIGVEGECAFEVNFGTDVFRFKPGNEWSWKVDRNMRMSGSAGEMGEELPSYSASV